MILDLDRGPLGRIDLDISHHLGVVMDEAEQVEIDLTGQLTVDNLRNRVILTGELNGMTVAECDRCLESFELGFEIPVEIQILRDTEQEEEDESDTCIIHQRNGEVDLQAPLGELALVALPQKCLCSEDCHGLCPQCGINLNRETCSCKSEEEDPRWAGLPTE